MGKLEEAAKPILEALIYGYPLNLGPSGQGVLARWIAKTTMTAEFMVPSQVAIKPWEREALRLSTQGLPHWQIWVGFYSGMELQSGGIFHHTVGLYHPSKVSIGVKNTQFTVLFLGRLFAFCISSENDRLAFQVGDEMKRAVRRLWPSDAAIVSWPPEASIDDRGAVALENMLGALLGTPVFGDA
jgi:hypothetical protein